MNIDALMIGRFVGTLFRYYVGRWIADLYNGFPPGNTLDQLCRQPFSWWLLTATMDYWEIRNEIRLGLGTGMMGAFTNIFIFYCSIDLAHGKR